MSRDTCPKCNADMEEWLRCSHVICQGGEVFGKVVQPAPAAPEATPAAKWSAEGKPDPHGNRYDCERAALAMGNLTDDELANGVYMADRMSFNLIAYQTAAKDRIRWLSRAMERMRGAVEAVAQGPQNGEIMALWITEQMARASASLTATTAPLCCICGKKDLSTVEGDGGEECELHDGRWTCSRLCYDLAVELRAP